MGFRLSSKLLAGHEVRLFKRQRERFERHGAVMVQELLADAEEIGGGRDTADLVQELAGWLDAHAPQGARVWIDPPGMESVVRLYKAFGDLRPDIVTVAGTAAFASADFAVCQNKPTEFSAEVKRLLATTQPVWTDTMDDVPLIYLWRLHR